MYVPSSDEAGTNTVMMPCHTIADATDAPADAALGDQVCGCDACFQQNVNAITVYGFDVISVIPSLDGNPSHISPALALPFIPPKQA